MSLNPGLAKTIQFFFCILFTMSHEDVLKSAIYVVHGSNAPRAAASRYSVSNRKILEIAIKLEFVQEERDNIFVESDNKQHIYIWVRTNL